MAAFLHFLRPSLPFLRRSREESAEERPPRPRLGLALSSGGAKGLAHVGVIQVLEENGIEIDAVAGTSMGAYVGALWAAGFDGKELEALAADMTAPRDVWRLVDPLFPPRRGFVRGEKIRKHLAKSLGDRTFDTLEKSLHVVATRLDNLERTVFREGEVVSAIVASVAVPGVVAPALRDGVEYIDGGVCDPLPVNYLKRCGEVDKVIAVNVLPPVGTLRRPPRPRRPVSLWRRLLRFLNRHMNYFAAGNLLDILRGAAMGAQMRLVERSARNADVLVTAISTQPRWHDYSNYRDYIEIGRRAAEAALPEIRALLGPEHPAVRATRPIHPPRTVPPSTPESLSCA